MGGAAIAGASNRPQRVPDSALPFSLSPRRPFVCWPGSYTRLVSLRGCPLGAPAAPQGRPQPPQTEGIPHGLHLRRPVAVGSHSTQYTLSVARFSTGKVRGYGPHIFSPPTQWSHGDAGHRGRHSALLRRSLCFLTSAVRARCPSDAATTLVSCRSNHGNCVIACSTTGMLFARAFLATWTHRVNRVRSARPTSPSRTSLSSASAAQPSAPVPPLLTPRPAAVPSAQSSASPHPPSPPPPPTPPPSLPAAVPSAQPSASPPQPTALPPRRRDRRRGHRLRRRPHHRRGASVPSSQRDASPPQPPPPPPPPPPAPPPVPSVGAVVTAWRVATTTTATAITSAAAATAAAAAASAGAERWCLRRGRAPRSS